MASIPHEMPLNFVGNPSESDLSRYVDRGSPDN